VANAAFHLPSGAGNDGTPTSRLEYTKAVMPKFHSHKMGWIVLCGSLSLLRQTKTEVLILF